jgi:hypothetical protein
MIAVAAGRVRIVLGVSDFRGAPCSRQFACLPSRTRDGADSAAEPDAHVAAGALGRVLNAVSAIMANANEMQWTGAGMGIYRAPLMAWQRYT